MGIEGNEEADRLAKAALDLPEVTIDIEPELREQYKKLDQHTLELWQRRWDEETTGRHYHAIQPEVNKKNKLLVDRNNRAREVVITRLRLGRCSLKHYLFQIKIGSDGKCDRCGVEETVRHWLLECEGTAELNRKLQQICLEKGEPVDVPTILTDPRCHDAIFSYTKDRNIRL